MDGWIFGWRYIAGLLFVHVLGNPDSKRSAAGCIECRRAGDDAVKIVRENLRGFQSLPSSGGAAIEVREFCVVTIKRIDQTLAFDRRFMNCPGPEVDALIGILHPDACASFMAGIGRGRRISPAESGRQGIVVDIAIPAAVSDHFEFPIPVVVAGIHTSIFMSESFVGFTVAAIRQNAGRSANCAPPPRPPPPAGAKAPAATACADVIVVSASFNAARLSQGAADAGITLTRRTSNTADDRTILLIRTPRECSVNVVGEL